jgi:hypothetical protein
MWFLAYLLIFSIVLVPLLRSLDRLRDAGRPAWWWAYAPLLPLLAVELVLRPVWGDYPNLFADWASMSVFVVFFSIGALVARHAGFEAALAAAWPGLGILGLVGLVLQFTTWHAWSPLIGNALLEWGIVGCLYGLGRRWQSGDRPLFAYFRDATLPFYVLHHAPSVVLAFFVVALPLDLWTKALIILAGTAAITFGFYHFLVRPFPFMRWLMGLRPNHA